MIKGFDLAKKEANRVVLVLMGLIGLKTKSLAKRMDKLNGGIEKTVRRMSEVSDEMDIDLVEKEEKIFKLENEIKEDIARKEVLNQRIENIKDVFVIK